MERIMRSRQHTFIQYAYVTLLIILSSFEYFFRASNLVLVLCCLAIVHYSVLYLKKQNLKELNYSIFFLLSTTIVVILQITSGYDKFNYLIGHVVGGLGIISIACMLQNKAIRVFCNIILCIACYSLAIYILCFIPPIENFFYDLAANFPSLNVEKALFEGGGANIVIYNFQSNFVSKVIGFHRNCGPFWEPGMFAFFICLSLFFELFILKRSKSSHLFAISVLICALISSFSTGGYIAGIVLLAFYFFNKSHHVLSWLIILPLTIITIHQITNLEYVGKKVSHQYNTAEYGSDDSRFGAFITQVDMIQNNPIIGGESINEYAKTKALASGTLLPFVNYGIPVGILFFVMLLYSFRNISYHFKSQFLYGNLLFIFILVLSFSQTILESKIISLLLYWGLQLHTKRISLK